MQSASNSYLLVQPLGSGSKGNSTYIGTRERGVLIYAVLSAKQTLGRLAESGLGDSLIEAVFIGHEHSDHIGGARVVQRKLQKKFGHGVPFWMTRGTYYGAPERCRPEVGGWLVSGVPVETASFSVLGIPSSHDTRDPVVFVVDAGELRAGVFTDMGRTTKAVEEALGTVDVALVEFNHDREMLINGHYAWPLKQRVLGPQGHLSNAQAAQLVERAASPRLKHLMLAHLSEDNNTPKAALVAAREALQRVGLADVEVRVAPQCGPLLPGAIVGQETPARDERPKPAPSTQSAQINLFA